MAPAKYLRFRWEGLSPTFSFLPEKTMKFNPHRAKIACNFPVPSFCPEKGGKNAN